MPEIITATDLALLAPVPLVHLRSAKDLQMPRVAFSSAMSELFADLERERGNEVLDVFIYASHSDGGFDPVASWHGIYVGVTDKIGAKPFRPASTSTDSYDHEIFWLVDGLRELTEAQCEGLELRRFIGYRKKKAYGNAFTPHRPLLVRHPGV